MIPGIPQFGFGTLAFAGIFLGVLLIFEALRQAVSHGNSVERARNRRMRLIARGATPEQVLKLLKPADAGTGLSRLPLLGALPKLLRQAGTPIQPGVFLACCLIGTITLTAAGAGLTRPAAAVALGLVGGVLLPVMVLRHAARRRLDTMTRQLPDALDLMARGLRVGHPLNTTIGAVARDMTDPLASEFGLILDQVSYGDDLVEAFADFAGRVETEDARYLATSVAIQHGTGGDLARVLNTLARVIRGRIAMRKRIKAISSEGRMTAMFLSALPVIIVALTSLTAPDYYAGVIDDPMFKRIAILVAGLTIANFLVMRRLVRFRF